MKNPLPLLSALAAVALLQVGCGMTSPIQTAANPLTTPDWGLLGAATATGAYLGDQTIGSTWGGPIGAATAMVGAQAYLNHANQRESQIVAEAKEEARREERAKLMQDYWLEASGQDYVGSWTGCQRDVRYDAGVYDGISYERRELPRQLYFQEPPR